MCSWLRGEDGHHLVTDYGDAFGWLRMNSISEAS